MFSGKRVVEARHVSACFSIKGLLARGRFKIESRTADTWAM